MKRLTSQVLLTLALVATSIIPTFAQESSGTIQGIVTDQSGGVLPGVTVSVKHVQTGRTNTFVTNEVGRYNAPSLQPGTYEITFNISGFEPNVLTGIELHVSDRLELNAKLGVTGVSQTVEVSAASQFVQASPAVSTLM